MFGLLVGVFFLSRRRLCVCVCFFVYIGCVRADDRWCCNGGMWYRRRLNSLWRLVSCVADGGGGFNAVVHEVGRDLSRIVAVPPALS